MKRIFNTLKSLGKIDIQIDYHKVFKETASQVIETNPREYGNNTDKMKKKNCIIRIEFFPSDKPMTALAYSHDLELALKDVYNQYLLWKPTN